MENFNFIEFHRTRDFSRKLNATFEFVKQNFKPLGKSILFIAGPPVLLASLVSGSFVSEFMKDNIMPLFGVTRPAFDGVPDEEDRPLSESLTGNGDVGFHRAV